MSERLEHAFRRFERAARDLRDGQESLRQRARRLESELLNANRRLEAVLDAVDSGVAVVARDGSILRTNRAFDALAPASTAGEPSQLARELCVGHDRRRSVKSIRRLHHEVDGDLRDLAVTTVPVEDSAGALVLTVKDTTEVRREEEEDGRRQRLEALGRMAAELAHELRNPLGAIRLFAAMLRDDVVDRPDSLGMVERILQCTTGLESTVANLLSFASPCRQQCRPVDLAVVAREACKLMVATCSMRDVRLLPPPAGATCSVDGDPEGLRQVVLNLLGNALAATDAGGRVEIDVATVRDTGRVLTVRDDGHGIEAVDLPRVFDPFFTRSEGGTGLGLSIVHGIVERHGGTVSLESAPGRGTLVRVELPTTSERTRGTAS